MRVLSRRRTEFAAVFVALALTSTQVALAAHGDPDDNFGEHGSATLDIAEVDTGNAVVARDGKITVAGYTEEGGVGDVLVVRYDTAGHRLSSFGGGLGYVITDFGGDERVHNGLQVLSNGKIVVAGYSKDGDHFKLVLAKYNANGTLDGQFGGGDGKVTRDYPGGGAKAYDLALAPDGKLIVAGGLYPGANQGNVAIWRFKANGKLDTTFGGGDGVATPNLGPGFDDAFRVLVMPNGKIVAGGWVTAGDGLKPVVVRLKANGSRDGTFGTNGVVIRDPTAYDYEGVNGLAMAGSKIVVAVSGEDVVLLRLKDDGRRDTTFGGGDGLVVRDLGSIEDARDVAIQEDGKIVVAGVRNSHPFVARFMSGGGVDSGFGTGSFQQLDETGTFNGIAFQSNGRILAAGNHNDFDLLLTRFLP